MEYSIHPKQKKVVKSGAKEPRSRTVQGGMLKDYPEDIKTEVASYLGKAALGALANETTGRFQRGLYNIYKVRPKREKPDFYQRQLQDFKSHLEEMKSTYKLQNVRELNEWLNFIDRELMPRLNEIDWDYRTNIIVEKVKEQFQKLINDIHQWVGSGMAGSGIHPKQKRVVKSGAKAPRSRTIQGGMLPSTPVTPLESVTTLNRWVEQVNTLEEFNKYFQDMFRDPASSVDDLRRLLEQMENIAISLRNSYSEFPHYVRIVVNDALDGYYGFTRSTAYNFLQDRILREDLKRK